MSAIFKFTITVVYRDLVFGSVNNLYFQTEFTALARCCSNSTAEQGLTVYFFFLQAVHVVGL